MDLNPIEIRNQCNETRHPSADLYRLQLNKMSMRRKTCSIIKNPYLSICAIVMCCSTFYMLYGYQTFVKVPRHMNNDHSAVEENLNTVSHQVQQLKTGEPQKYEAERLLQEASSNHTSDKDITNRSIIQERKKLTTGRTSKAPVDVTTHATNSSENTDSNVNQPSAAPLNSTINEEEILKVQAKRKQRIIDVCKKYKLEIGGNFLFKDTYRHMYVIEDQKLLFCYIPKVGCSNWKRVLMVLDGKRDVTDDITSREAHAHNGITRFGQISKEEQKYRLQNYRKVMFVRDPLARVVSAYKNKFADLNVYRTAPTVFHNFGRRIVGRYRQDPSPLALTTGENVTFSEFVTYLTNKEERTDFDRHWKEMYKLCSPCQIRYDFIGKLEKAYDEAEYILRNMNFTKAVSFPGRENSHPTNVGRSTDEYFKNFSTKTLEALWNIYHTDFELFGYKKPKYIP